MSNGFTTIAVHNGGGYVISFSVKATAEGEPWSVESGNYGEGSTHTVQVPIDSIDITLEVRGEVFIDTWKTALKQQWPDTSTWPSAGLSYHTSGTTTDMHVQQDS